MLCPIHLLPYPRQHPCLNHCCVRTTLEGGLPMSFHLALIIHFLILGHLPILSLGHPFSYFPIITETPFSQHFIHSLFFIILRNNLNAKPVASTNVGTENGK